MGVLEGFGAVGPDAWRQRSNAPWIRRRHSAIAASAIMLALLLSWTHRGDDEERTTFATGARSAAGLARRSRKWPLRRSGPQNRGPIYIEERDCLAECVQTSRQGWRQCGSR